MWLYWFGEAEAALPPVLVCNMTVLCGAHILDTFQAHYFSMCPGQLQSPLSQLEEKTQNFQKDLFLIFSNCSDTFKL